jgi:hypothetical protein
MMNYLPTAMVEWELLNIGNLILCVGSINFFAQVVWHPLDTLDAFDNRLCKTSADHIMSSFRTMRVCQTRYAQKSSGWSVLPHSNSQHLEVHSPPTWTNSTHG